MRKLFTAIHLCAGVSLLGIATGAQAQSGADSAATAAPQQVTEGAAADIVVTGSRTIKNGDQSPSPVTVIGTKDLLQAQPGTLSNALNILPVFSGSRTTASNPTFSGAATGGNSAANQLNLRNLGSVRTLVLLDGYRVPPTTFNNVVDVDIIPQMLIQRVDTVTGGVSAVYGSDAVSGVVNYIIDKKFKGISVDLENGISQRGDAYRYQAGIALGTDFADGRGHVEGSFQIIHEDGIENRSSRPWIYGAGVAGSGTAANPYVLLPNVRQSNFTSGGLITSATVAGALGYAAGTRLQFAPDGTLTPFVNGAFAGVAGTAGSPNLQIGGDGATYDSTLVGRLHAKQFFGRASYDLTDTITAYAQVSGNIKTNQAYGEPVQLTNLTFRADNPYLPSSVRSQLASAGVSTFNMSEIMGNYSRLNNEARSKQYLFSGGLDGKLGDYDWGVNYTHGLSKLNTYMLNNVNNQRLAAALDAVVGPDGRIACYASTQTATAAAYADCVPINPFGAGNANGSGLLDYVLQPTVYRATTKQDDVSAHIGGSPFELPAGPVTIALSAEWRKVSFHSETTNSSTATADCTGLRYNCVGTGATPTLLWAFGFAPSPKISQTVREAALEIDVPLLADVSFAKALSINGAARYTHYNTSGTYWPWKLGAVWQVTDKLRFRATRSRDIRAPTLFELAQPVNSVPISFADLLTHTSPRVQAYDLPNPNLKAEIAQTFTGGVSWQTPLRGLSVTVDYYKIKIKDAIVLATGFNPALQNLCYASGGTSSWCAFQERPNGYTDTSAANTVTRWYTQNLNIGSIDTEGVDVELNYGSRLFGRPMNLRFLGAYQPHAYYRTPGVPTIDQGNAAFGPIGYSNGSKWRLTGTFRFQPAEGVTIDLLERYRGPVNLNGDESLNVVNNRVRSFATTNLTTTFDLPSSFGNAQLSFNVSNLFDAKAPAAAYTGNGTRAGLRDGFVLGDDVIGRYFNIALRFRH